MNIEPAVVHVPPRHEVLHAHAAHEKLRRVFGERPHTSFHDGLQAMAAWVRQRGARSSAPFEGIEIMKGLPDVWIRS